MTPKRIVGVALIGALLFVGVKFSLVYVNYLQLRSIMGSEALDARRTDAGESEIENRIFARVDDGSAELPDDVEFSFEGVGDPEETLIVYATYTQEVDLLVTQIQMKMDIEARAEPPLE